MHLIKLVPYWLRVILVEFIEVVNPINANDRVNKVKRPLEILCISHYEREPDHDLDGVVEGREGESEADVEEAEELS